MQDTIIATFCIPDEWCGGEPLPTGQGAWGAVGMQLGGFPSVNYVQND